MRIDCPPGCTPRGYIGEADHAGMAEVLSAFNRSTGVGELVTVEKIAALYAHISPVEIERSVVIIEHADDGMVGYGPTAEDDTPEGRMQYWVAPLHPGHLAQPL